MDNKRLAKNAVLNTIKTVSGIAFPLITFPYVSRVLGVEPLGIYNFATSIISYFLLIAGLGISTYAIREGSQYREDKDKLQRFVSEVFSINVVSMLFAYLGLVLCMIFIPKLIYYRHAILILSIEIISTTLGTVWLCNIFEDFRSITIRTIVFQFISLILMFLFVKKSEDLYKYITIVALSNSGSNLVNFLYVRRNYCRYGLTFQIDWKKHLKPILIIFSTTVAVTIYVSSDNTMLGFMTSDYQVGLYSTAVKIYTIVKNILSSILIVMIPRFSLSLTKGKPNETKELFSNVFWFLTIIMLPLITGLFMISYDIISIISGVEFVAAATSLRLLSIAILFSLYAFMYVQCILIPAKKERVVFLATGISAIVNILLNIIIIPTLGINGAALTTIVAELLTFILVCYEGHKIITINGLNKDIISCIVGCVGIVGICMISKFIDVFALRFAIRLIGSTLIYAIILVAMKNKTILRTMDLIKPNKIGCKSKNH